MAQEYTGWEGARRAVVTGSDAAALAGRGRRLPGVWTTQIQVWAHKAGYDMPFSGDPEKVRAGNILEPVVAQVFAHDRGCRLIEPTALQLVVAETFGRGVSWDASLLPAEDGRRRLFVRAIGDPFGGTPDFLVQKLDPEDEFAGPGVLEIKVPGLDSLPLWSGEQPPLGPRIQATWYAGLLGLSWAAVSALVGGHYFRHFQFPVTKQEVAWLQDLARAWWRRHVDGAEPPPVTATDGPTIDRMFEGGPGGSVKLGPEFEATWLELERLRAARGAIDDVYAVLRNQVALAMGSASEARIEGTAVGFTRHTTSTGSRPLLCTRWKYPS